MAQQSVPSETRRSKRDRNPPPQTTVPTHSNESRTPQNRPHQLNDPEPADGSHSGNHLGNDTFSGVAGDNGMPSGSQELPSLQSQPSATTVPSKLYTMYRNARLCQLEEQFNAEIAREAGTAEGREEMLRIMMQFADTRLCNIETYYNLAEGPPMAMMDPGHLDSAEAPFINGFPDMPPQQEPSWEDLAGDLNAG